MRSRAIPTTLLTQVIRQAGVLKENSIAVLDGHVQPTSDVKAAGRRPWYVIDKFSESHEVRAFLLMLFEEVLSAWDMTCFGTCRC